MSGRDSDSGAYERIDSGILEAVTDFDSVRNTRNVDEVAPPAGGSDAEQTRAEGDEAVLDDRPKAKISIPPPIPEDAVREPGAQRISDTEQAGSEAERVSEAEQVLGALAPFYEQKDDSEHIRLSDLDDISLRIDPDKLPSLAPLPLPAPEQRSPLLVRGAIVLAIAGAGVAAWALGFRGSAPVEPADPEPPPVAMVASAPVAAPADRPRPEPEAPEVEQPRKEEVFEFSVDEAAPPEPKRGDGARAERAEASARTGSSKERAAPADTKSKRVESSEATEKKSAQKASREGERAALSAETPHDEGEKPETSPAGGEAVEKKAEKAAASPAAAEPAPVGATATAAASTAAPATATSMEKSASGAADEKPARETLDRDEVAAGLNKIKDSVKACVGDKHGIAKVDVTIAGSGRVRRALVTGVFAGTPEGSCIARTVRAARFPKFSGEPVSVEFPFVL